MAGGSSAGGSSANTNGNIKQAGSMYQDESKVYGAVTIYTTLEDPTHEANDSKLDLQMLSKA